MNASRDVPMHVLVVDDDDAIRDLLRMVLEDAGYAVAEAPDGVAALEWLRASPDRVVVLLDLMMPQLDGAGVLAAVVADERLRGRHAFVLVTAGMRPIGSELARLLTDFAVPVVRKPFKLDALVRCVGEFRALLDQAL